MNILRYVLVLMGLILAMGTSAIAAGSFEFDQLERELSSEVKARLERYRGLISLAHDGDPEAQIILASVLRDESAETSMAIAHHMVKTNGLSLDQPSELDVFTLVRLMEDLTQHYINPEHPWFDPEQAFLISTQLDQAGSEFFSMTWSLLFDASFLPDTTSLREAWQDGEESQTYGSVDEWLSNSSDDTLSADVIQPRANSEGLKACPNALGNLATVLDEHKRLQSLLIADGLVTDDELIQYQQAMDSIEVHKIHTKLSLYHMSESLNYLINLMIEVLRTNADLGEANVLFAQRVDLPNVDATIMNQNSLLSLAMTLDQLNLTVYCDGDDYLLDYKESSTPVSEPIFIAGLLMESRVLDNQDTYLRWNDGKEYRGQVQNFLPNGAGELIVTTDKTYQGNFVDGIISGQVSIKTTDGSYQYQGQVDKGMYHGKGRLFDRYGGFDFDGEFVQGGFLGNGSIYYLNRTDPQHFQGMEFPESALRYTGPIRQNEPHGQGVCSKGEVQYNCTFYDGQLIGIGKASLIPGVSQLPSFE